MSAERTPTFDRPLDRLLLLLREHGPDAYRAGPQPGTWVARCPCCGERKLLIHESRPGGTATVSCSIGCPGEDVIAELTRPRVDPWELVRELVTAVQGLHARLEAATAPAEPPTVEAVAA